MKVRAERGVTLIELVIVLGISLGAAAAAFTLFQGQSRAMRAAQASSDIQDNARVAMEMLTRDIRGVGFLVNPKSSLRIEDNCGRADNDVQLSAENTVTYQGGANVQDAGNYVKTTEADGCPNGSDRLLVIARPSSDVASACNNVGQCRNNEGVGNNYDIPCDNDIEGNASVATEAECEQTAERMSSGITVHCSGPISPPVLTSVCGSDDANSCLTIEIDNLDCYANCGSGGGNDKCVNISFQQPGDNSFAGSEWDVLGTKSNDGISFAGIIFRAYQLIDLDSDGSTELAYSDIAPTALLFDLASDPVSGQWNPIANYIDDFQVAWSKKSAPTTFFNSTNMLNFATCVTGASVGCLKDMSNDPPAALRVTIVARSARRDFSQTGQVMNYTRPAIENNSPAVQTYDPSAAVTVGAANCYSGATCGCGAAGKTDYATCSGNGNSQGYVRRIVTQVIGLRNLAGYSF